MTQAMRRAAGPLRATAPLGDVLARERGVVQATRGFGLKSAMPFGPEYGAAPLLPETTAEQVWATIAPYMDVLIGATAEETRFLAVIDPTFSWLGRLPLLGAGLSRWLVQVSSHPIYHGPARTFAWRHARSGGRAYEFRVSYQPPGSPFGAAHVVDLLLLLGTPVSWAAIPLLGQASWEQVNQAGRQVQQL